MATHRLRLKYPIVLIHGLGAKSAYGPVDYFYGTPKRLRDAGNFLLIASLTAWQTIEHRAEQLKLQIEAAIPEGKVNLIGHSMGGLDARYLTSRLGLAERVASVTTIGTPNRGSIMGDIAAGMVPEQAFSAAESFLSLLGSSTGGFKQISHRYVNETFAGLAPNQPDVAYFSATSAITKPVMKNALPIFWFPHRVLQKHDGDNDGFVSVESAKWGEHICTYAGDHYAQIGQIMGFARGMDYTGFMDEIISRLKREGM